MKSKNEESGAFVSFVLYQADSGHFYFEVENREQVLFSSTRFLHKNNALHTIDSLMSCAVGEIEFVDKTKK